MDDETKKYIEQTVTDNSKNSFDKRIGDTPTDSLQLVNKKYLAMGHVKNTGAYAPSPYFVPPRWTASKTATGTYVITHTLNTTDYGVMITMDVTDDPTNNVATGVVLTRNRFSFTVNTINLVAPIADKDYDFYFLVLRK